MDELIEVVRFLRSPEGCPWDRAQTVASLAPYVLEEAYEILAALDDPEALDEELGDLLFTVTLLMEIRREAGGPDLHALASRAARKMRERHPRLFGHPEDRRTWSEIKGERPGDLGVSERLPALLRAQRVGEAAANRGFDWPDATGPRDKIAEELDELDEAIRGAKHDRMRDELGDLLFSTVNLARHLGIDAESALVAATAKFERRYARMVEEAERAGLPMDAEALEPVWEAVK